jgi:hypothetical protein
VTHHPEGRPDALRRGETDARKDSPILEGLFSKREDRARGVLLSVGLGPGVVQNDVELLASLEDQRAIFN